MKIKFKDDALILDSKKIKINDGYNQNRIQWRKSISEIIEFSKGDYIDVDTKYLFKDSFNVKHPDGYIVSIPSFMVKEILDDERIRTEEKFNIAFNELKFCLKLHKKPFWIIPSDFDYKVSKIEPKPEELPNNTQAVLYELKDKNIETIKIIKSKAKKEKKFRKHL